jgi:hypothetical protein
MSKGDADKSSASGSQPGHLLLDVESIHMLPHLLLLPSFITLYPLAQLRLRATPLAVWMRTCKVLVHSIV